MALSREITAGRTRAIAVLVALLACLAMPAHAHGAFQRGMVLTGQSSGSYLTPRSDHVVDLIAGGGSDRTAIFTQWFMDAPTSSSIAPDPARTPSDDAIRHAAAQARKDGLAVTLKPQIGIRTNSWIGAAHPADLDAFWADYRSMVLHYADLGTQVGATTLVIGTEMKTLSSDEARWRALIAEVRQHFHGALTYAANYDEFQQVPFWDALDYVGVDAYFALADQSDPAPTTTDLVNAWTSRGYLADLAKVSRRTGKQVLFTEIGYRGVRTTAVHPNIWQGTDVTDTLAQANAYEAFYLAVAQQPWLAGAYWWEAPSDSWWVQDYNPAGKPAATVMKTWNSLLSVPDVVVPPLDLPVGVPPVTAPAADPGIDPPLVDPPALPPLSDPSVVGPPVLPPVADPSSVGLPGLPPVTGPPAVDPPALPPVAEPPPVIPPAEPPASVPPAADAPPASDPGTPAPPADDPAPPAEDPAPPAGDPAPPADHPTPPAGDPAPSEEPSPDQPQSDQPQADAPPADAPAGDSPPPDPPAIPEPQEPADGSSPPPAAPAPARVAVKLRGRRVRGTVAPYSPACGGHVTLRLQVRSAGAWRPVHTQAHFAPTRNGRFDRKLRSGRLRVMALFSSSCGDARSRWASAPR
jgi:hypothetical protein